MQAYMLEKTDRPGKFMRLDQNKKPTLSGDISRALRFETRDKAKKFLETNVKADRRSDWTTVMVEVKELTRNRTDKKTKGKLLDETDDEFHADKVLQRSKNTTVLAQETDNGVLLCRARQMNINVPGLDPFDWEAFYENIEGTLEALKEYRTKLIEKLHLLDAELCDLFHACEFFQYDLYRGYKLYAMIRERRIWRRFCKNELQLATKLLSMKPWEIVNEGMEIAAAEVRQQYYVPRALPELFGAEKSKKAKNIEDWEAMKCKV